MEELSHAWSWEPFEPEYITTVIEGGMASVEMEFTVAGTVTGAGYGMVYSPFWSVISLVGNHDDLIFSELLNVRISDNRALSSFKSNANMSFSRINPIHDNRPFAMTVYDSEFYETLEPLRQNIIVIDVATPFIYIISIAIGFLTSVLLTRRRKSEFAIMRSIGIGKNVIFISAFTEQIILGMIGSVFGFMFVAFVWNYTSLTRPAIFLACYLVGAIFAAKGAAGTNVMKVLRDRRE